LNRHILFLIFVSLQAQVSFSAISEKAQSWERLEKAFEEEGVIGEMLYKFEKRFDDTVNKDGLSPESLKSFFLKNMCKASVLEFLKKKFETTTDPKKQKAIILQAFAVGRACVRDMMQAKAEYEYEKFSIPKQIYDKPIQEKIGIEFANEAYDGFTEGIKGSCSHLVDDKAFKQKLHQKIDELHKK
jgi:hypothetical protein